jgi:RNA polymerase sigma-70 factor (ECF subfamily)
MNKEQQFKQLIDENKQRILSICHYYAPSREDEQDMYQEILINIWKSLETFRGDSSIRTWIYRVAVNTSLSFTGKAFKRMRLNVDADVQKLNSAFYDEEEVNLKVETEQKMEELQILLNRLSVIEKALMSLVLEGLSSAEIASVIGLTETNVRVKIHRIKESLRKQMKGENNGTR